MDHADLVKLSLGLHVPLLAAAVFAFYRYGDRSELFKSSLRATDESRSALGSDIAEALGAAIGPVFEDAGTNPSLVFGGDGNPIYSEDPINPVGSEVYREAIKRFVIEHGNLIADYWSLRASRDAWCVWARRLSWGILMLLWWEAVASAILLLETLNITDLSDDLIRIGFLPTAALFFGCLGCLPPLLRSHDRIMRIRNDYEEL